MFAKFYLKSLLTNKSLWGWGVGFMLFWLFMGAYIFTTNSASHQVHFYNAAVWYALIALISASTIATSISYSIYYSNSSLAYSFRFTRLKPLSYIGNALMSTSIMGAILGALMLIFTYLLFSNQAGYPLVPALPAYAIVVSVGAGAFMFLLAAVLITLVNNYMGLKNVTFVALIPLLLTYVFGFSQLGLKMPAYIVYGSPFTEISDLLFQAYYGHPSTLVLSDPTSPLLNYHYQIAGLAAWIVILFFAATALIKKIKPKPIEEARQV